MDDFSVALDTFMVHTTSRMPDTGQFYDALALVRLGSTNRRYRALFSEFDAKVAAKGCSNAVRRDMRLMRYIHRYEDREEAGKWMHYSEVPLSPQPPKSWFLRYFSGTRALSHLYDFSETRDLDWVVRHVHYEGRGAAFHKCPADALTAKGRDWLVERTDPSWYARVLDRADLLTRDAVDLAWLVKHFPKADMAFAMRRVGLLDASLGWAWYDKHVAAEDVVGILRELDIVSAEPGEDWYRLRVSKIELYEVLESANLAKSLSRRWIEKYVAMKDRIWALGTAGHAVSRAELERVRALDRFQSTIDAGMMRFDDFAGGAAEARGWFAEFMPKNKLLHALILSELVTADAGRSWFDENLNAHDATTALILAGLYFAE